MNKRELLRERKGLQNLSGEFESRNSRQHSRFTEDDIRRDDLPRDAFELIHDLAYDHEGRDRSSYRLRAQQILMRPFGQSPRRFFVKWNTEKSAYTVSIPNYEGGEVVEVKAQIETETSINKELGN